MRMPKDGWVMRTCPSADGRWRVLTCHRQVIHYAPFKSFSIVETKNKVSEVKGLDSRGGVPPLGRRRSKLSTGQFLCTASVQVLSINRPKKRDTRMGISFFESSDLF